MGPNGNTYIVGLALHRLTDGTYLLPQADLDIVVNNLNDAFNHPTDPERFANIQFVVVYSGIINVGSEYESVDFSEQDNVHTLKNIPDAINIYFINGGEKSATFSSGQNSWYNSYVPVECQRNAQHIFMTNFFATSMSPIHEMGHFFDLFHTHEGVLFGAGNTVTTGDLITDTDESDKENPNCLTHPILAKNFMSGSDCRNSWSPLQIRKMRYVLFNRRNNLLRTNLLFKNEINGQDAGGTLEAKQGTLIQTPLSNTSVALKNGTSADVKTNLERVTVSSEIFKHKEWNSNPSDFFLSRTITVSPGANQRATFVQLWPTVFSTDLVTSTQTNVGVIGFHDPWYVDNTNAQPNEFLPILEQGLPYSPTGSFFATTGGVFKDINPSNAPAFYSIRALDQLINGFAYFLDEWTSTGGVSFTNANASTTSLEFTGTNTTVTANLKAYFASSTKTATSGSNGEKLATHVNNSNLHLVYVDNGRLYYTKSTTGGSSWTKEKRLDSSTSYDCLNPGIGVELDGDVHIVYERESAGTQGTQYDVQYISKISGSWSAIEDLATGNMNVHPRPTVHVGYYGDVWVAWRKNDTFSDIYNICFKYKTNGSSVWTASSIVPETDEFSWSPTLITGDFDTNPNNTHVFWQDASEQVIKYIAGEYQSSTWTWDSQASLLPGLSILSEHNLPSVQADPDTLYVTWQATEEGGSETKRKVSPGLSMSCPPATIDYPVVCYQKYSGSWEGLTLFRTNSTCDRKPVITSWATSLGRQVMIAFEKAEDVVVTVRREENGEWQGVSTLSTTGANPAITSVNDAEPNLVYTKSTGLPRALIFDDDLLPPPTKEEEEYIPHSRLVALRVGEDLDGGPNAGSNGDLAIEIGDLEHHLAGSVERIKPKFR